MNENRVQVVGFSNPESAQRFAENYPGEPLLQEQATWLQCGGCSFFAPFNADWGLCCFEASRHHLETVKEHFTCPSACAEGWHSHSFTDDASSHCQCDWLEGVTLVERRHLRELFAEGDERLLTLLEVGPRLSYEESCQELLTNGFLDEIPPLPTRMPRHDDDMLGFSLFKGGLEENKLSNLSLPRTFFARSRLERCSFANTDWSESRMCWNDFRQVDFSYADLSRSDLRASIFEKVRFKRTNLTGADLRHAQFSECDFTGANLTGTKLTLSQRSQVTLTEKQVSQIRWYRSPGREPVGG